MRKVWLFPLMVLGVLLVACNGQAAASTAAPATATTRRHDDTTTVTTTPTPTPTPTATATATPSPTPTPTVSLPVSLGTPLPPLEPIGDRWGEVQEVAQYVAPYGGSAWLGQGNVFEATVYGDKVAVWKQGNKVAEVPVVVEAGDASTGDIRLAVGENKLAVLTNQSIDVYDWQGVHLLSISPPEDKGQFIYLAISPNGKMVAYVTGEQGTAEWFWVVSADTGNLLFRQHCFGPVVFSANSRYLAVPFDRRLDVYDTQSGGKLVYSAWMGDWIVPFALSPSGKRVALYHKEQKIVEVIEGGKSIRVIHQRLWGTDAQKVRWVQMVFSPSEQYLGIAFGGKGYSKFAVFDIATGERTTKGDGCLKEVDDVGKATCPASADNDFKPAGTAYLATTRSGWEFVIFGRSLYQCVITQHDYQCHRLEQIPDFLKKRFSQEAFTDHFPPFWFQHDDTGNIWAGIWRDWDSSISISAKVLQGTLPLWQHTFVDGTLAGTVANIVSGALSPDGTFLGIGGIDYGMYPGQAKLIVRFIALQRGATHPPSLQVKVPDEIYKVSMALCGHNHLALAVPGAPLVVYDLTTQQRLVQFQTDRTLVSMVCNAKTLAALDTAGVLHVYGIPALDKGGSNP